MPRAINIPAMVEAKREKIEEWYITHMAKLKNDYEGKLSMLPSYQKSLEASVSSTAGDAKKARDQAKYEMEMKLITARVAMRQQEEEDKRTFLLARQEEERRVCDAINKGV